MIDCTAEKREKGHIQKPFSQTISISHIHGLELAAFGIGRKVYSIYKEFLFRQACLISRIIFK
jgi:hypothetical protein